MNTKLCRDTQCRRSGQLLPLTEFPRNRSRPDKRNIYCLVCSLRRTHEYRARLGAKKAAAKALQVEQLERKANKPAKKKPTIVQRVFVAVSKGHRTREAITDATKLCEDTVCDALARLVLDAEIVKVVCIGEERQFHLAA